MALALVPLTKNSAIITFLMDRSYSMKKVLHATIEGFNGYLGELQREKDATIDFTLLTFDSVSIDRVHNGVPIHEARMLTEDTYVPRGGTPLIEAAIKTIIAVEEIVANRTDQPRVTICIQTDGEENQSKSDFTRKGLKDLIKQKESEGWQFNFLGTGIDAYTQAEAFGFDLNNTMSYTASDAGATRSAFASTAQNAASFSAGRSSNSAYTAKNRAEAKDQFYRTANINSVIETTDKPGKRPKIT